MKKLITALATIMVTAVAYGQGKVQLNNRIVGSVEARVFQEDGSGAGAGWTAQLWGKPKNEEIMLRLFPTTDFRTSSLWTAGYVNSVTVSVPGGRAGETATLQMVAFSGADWDSSLRRGISPLIDVVLGGGTIPPAPLAGLSGFSIGALVPEPSTYALGFLGLAALVLRRRK